MPGVDVLILVFVVDKTFDTNLLKFVFPLVIIFHSFRSDTAEVMCKAATNENYILPFVLIN